MADRYTDTLNSMRCAANKVSQFHSLHNFMIIENVLPAELHLQWRRETGANWGTCPGWKGLCPGCAPVDEVEVGQY